jgi:hypothetical protein
MKSVRQDNIVVDPRSAVLEHLDAFNQHSSDRLLAGFSADAVWATGQDVFEGQAALAELFEPGLWAHNPSLTILSLIADAAGAAAELREELTVNGERRSFNIAVFFVVNRGLIRRAKVYREGSADID